MENTTVYWPKPVTSNRKDKVVINRLRIGHSKIYILCAEKNLQCVKPAV